MIGSKGLSRPRQIDADAVVGVAARPLYAYVGAGLSMSAGLPSWHGAAEAICKYLTRIEGVEASCNYYQSSSIEAALDDFIKLNYIDSDSGQDISVFDVVDKRLFARAAVINMIFRYRAPVGGGRGYLHPRIGQLPSAEDLHMHSLLWRFGTHGIITPNYDVLLERAFDFYDHHGDVRVYRYNAAFLPFVTSSPRFIVKIHGDVNDIRTMIFSPSSSWRDSQTLGGLYGARCSKAYNTMLAQGSMLYIGNGFRDYTFYHLHKRWRSSPDFCTGLRIAIIPKWEVENVKACWESNEWDEAVLDDILFIYAEAPDETLLSRLWGTKRVIAELFDAVSAHRPRGVVKRPSFNAAKDIFQLLYQERKS